jgi:Uma2 family endonuclease
MTRDLLTLGEFERLPEKESRLELSRGTLVREPQPGARHGAVVVALLFELVSHVRDRELGRVVVEAGFLLSENPPTVRRPDTAFVSFDRWPGALPEGFWPLAPDLAVEVVSPSNAAADIHEKALQYLGAGSRLVWVVQPSTRSVEVWKGEADIRLVRNDGVLVGGDVLPGFALEVGRLFEP